MRLWLDLPAKWHTLWTPSPSPSPKAKAEPTHTTHLDNVWMVEGLQQIPLLLQGRQFILRLLDRHHQLRPGDFSRTSGGRSSWPIGKRYTMPPPHIEPLHDGPTHQKILSKIQWSEDFLEKFGGSYFPAAISSRKKKWKKKKRRKRSRKRLCPPSEVPPIMYPPP